MSCVSGHSTSIRRRGPPYPDHLPHLIKTFHPDPIGMSHSGRLPTLTCQVCALASVNLLCLLYLSVTLVNSFFSVTKTSIGLRPPEASHVLPSIKGTRAIPPSASQKVAAERPTLPRQPCVDTELNDKLERMVWVLITT